MDDGSYRDARPPLAAPIESLAGIDTIRREGERLIVFAPQPMVAWRVGRYRRTAIHYGERRYSVARARPVVGGHEYTLDPWPLLHNELASQEIHYDASYVRDRQEEAQRMRELRRQAWALVPLWPLFGFLPRSLKAKLHRRYGFEPIAGTRRSVLLEIVALMLLFVFTIVRAGNGMDWLTREQFRGAERDTILGIATIVDTVMRISILYDESYEPYGYWEWLVHPDIERLIRRGYAAFKARRSLQSRSSK